MLGISVTFRFRATVRFRAAFPAGAFLRLAVPFLADRTVCLATLRFRATLRPPLV